MMRLTFLFILTSLNLQSQAQLPSLFQDLEGTWYLKARDRAVFSDWEIQNDGSLVGRVFEYKCRDTVEWSRFTVRMTATDTLLLLTTDTLPGLPVQVFRPDYMDANGWAWTNSDPNARPRKLSWSFYNGGNLAFQADNQELEFRHLLTHNVRFSASVFAGTNYSTFHYDDFQEYFQFKMKAGVEAGIGLTLSNRVSPWACRIELAYSRRDIGIESPTDLYVSANGTFELSTFSLAIMPELQVGKKRNLTFSTGFFMTLSGDRSFRGQSGFGYLTEHRDLNVNSARGLMAGVTCRLPHREGAFIVPYLYARGMFEVLNDPATRAVSVGVLCRVGK